MFEDHCDCVWRRKYSLLCGYHKVCLAYAFCLVFIGKVGGWSAGFIIRIIGICVSLRIGICVPHKVSREHAAVKGEASVVCIFVSCVHLGHSEAYSVAGFKVYLGGFCYDRFDLDFSRDKFRLCCLLAGCKCKRCDDWEEAFHIFICLYFTRLYVFTSEVISDGEGGAESVWTSQVLEVESMHPFTRKFCVNAACDVVAC